MELPEISDFRELFLSDIPLLDVRAPVEFAAGAFPHTENLPLLEDKERHLIGIRYKENGQEAAIELGRQLIDGQPKAERTAAWKDFVARHPEGALYCFRGGMRSKISQEWIHEATGVAYPRIKGGYKALRNFLLNEIEVSCQEIEPIILGGRTGAGKTIVLRKLANSIDLEGLAWHRGSAFGRHATPQPTQIDFENRLAIELIRHRASSHAKLILEDESKAVGSRHLPPILYERMSASPLVMLDVSLEERIHNSIQEYVIEALREYQNIYGEENGFQKWAEYATESLKKISRRLGGVRYKEMNDKLQHAIQILKRTGAADAHADWISQLLTDYYDPMYDYQIARKSNRIIFSGDMKQVEEYLR
ncbi:tRNA 2-selenouridine(34) synthase MnmH [Thiolapillus brandeum]|uniref:tRNA 2-selenouridine synthase n=1 Tax=Thiolapillus brandeum TaxID=1076588 RepID=A0A7U6GJB7_9GAMM|nr:tRNA 2-selenouridine(34) synthase MnmH [Thiolapillus brandeum]BAO44674.1 tRNA 2-selenouridine synthase [Thiolapillus brandeum]